MAFFCLAAVLSAVTQTTVTTSGGTTNSIPKFTGPSTIGNSAVAENAGNVSIGTVIPTYPFQVRTGTNEIFNVRDRSAWGVASGVAIQSVDDSNILQVPMTFHASQFDFDSNVGIKIANPGYPLQVKTGSNQIFNVRDRSAWGVASGVAIQSVDDSNVVQVPMTFHASQFDFDNYVGIGTTSPAYMLDVNGYIPARGAFVFPDGTFQTTAATGGDTITGVLPGSGLSGGGYSGNVTLSVDGTVARNNASNTFTAQQPFTNYPLQVSNTALFVDNLQSNQWGIRSTVNSGIAAESWNKAWHDTSWSSGSIIAGYAGSGKTQMFHVDTRGTTYTYNGYVAGGFDYAELVKVAGGLTLKYEPGDVLVIDKAGSSRFALSSEPYSRLVAGVYSTSPGVLGSPHPMDAAVQEDEVPLALLGQLPCKVSTENGAINVGDLLVTSSTPGHAMRADDAVKPGTILGKALEALPYGTGKIKILLTLQ